MRYLSVCSGVEAATLAWKPLGWEAVGFAEIEPFPSAVLEYHYPEVTNFGDFTKIEKKDVSEFDLLVGGTPCQDFSVAGKGEGWEGKRGSLTYEYVRLLQRTMPTWFVWENVPGVLSGEHAEGFISFLKAIKELGYDVGWRTLDAQYVRVPGFERAVPQRRRRVFVVGSIRKGCVREVLFKPESLCWNTPQSREERKSTPAYAEESTYSYCPEVCGNSHVVQNVFTNKAYNDYQTAEVGKTLLASDSYDTGDLVCTVMAHGQANAEINTEICPTLNCDHEQPIVCVHGSQDPISNSEVANCIGRNQGLENVVAIAGNTIGRKPGNGGNGNGFDESWVSYTLTSADRHAVCFQQNTRDEVRYINGDGKIAGALAASPGVKQQNYIKEKSIVRRLTPVECERLMGFPDNYTRIPWRGKSAEECPDGPRYKACGNSMCVNVMRWLGMRIERYGI